jgi:hypothetical protein
MKSGIRREVEQGLTAFAKIFVLDLGPRVGGGRQLVKF